MILYYIMQYKHYFINILVKHMRCNENYHYKLDNLFKCKDHRFLQQNQAKILYYRKFYKQYRLRNIRKHNKCMQLKQCTRHKVKHMHRKFLQQDWPIKYLCKWLYKHYLLKNNSKYNRYKLLQHLSNFSKELCKHHRFQQPYWSKNHYHKKFCKL